MNSLNLNQINRFFLLSKMLVTAFLVMGITGPAFSQGNGNNTIESSQAGNWNDKPTWSGNKPKNKSKVTIKHTIRVNKGGSNKITNVSFSNNGSGTPKLIIPSGFTLEVSGAFNAAKGNIEVNGTLDVAGNFDASNSTVTVNGTLDVTGNLQNFRNGNFSGPNPVTLPNSGPNGNDSLIYPLSNQGGKPAVAIGNVSSGTAFSIDKVSRNPKTAKSSATTSTLNDISSAEYFTISPDNSLNNNEVRVTLFWDRQSLTDFSQVADKSNLVVAHYDNTNSQWENYGNSGSGGSTGGEGYVTSNPTQSFSPFTYGTTSSNNPLPVELTYFRAEADGNRVTLNWQTASETNNSHFLIQRRTDKGGFENVGRKEGFGTSYEAHTYRFQERVSAQGTVYYRLKQVDFDGSFEYSDIKAVKGNNTQKALALSITGIYPNPFIGQLRMQVSSADDQAITLQLRSIAGNLHQQKRLSGARTENEVTWRGLANLPSGTYILTAQTNNNRVVKRIVKQ